MRKKWSLGSFMALVLALGLVVAGCGGGGGGGEDPPVMPPPPTPYETAMAGIRGGHHGGRGPGGLRCGEG